MLTKVANYLRIPSRTRGKDNSVSKKRVASQDRGADNAKEHGPRKENNGNGKTTLLSNGTDGVRPPLKEVGSKSDRTVNNLSLLPAQIEERRLEEKEFIRQNDSSSAEVWFLVDVSWLQEWKHFVTKNSPLPGPIDNSRLVDARTGEPKPGLRPVNDYRGVNAAIWAFWQERYGGGPSVRRRHLDLYTPPADQEDEASEANSAPSASSRGARGANVGPPADSGGSTRRSPEASNSGRQQQRSEEPPPSPQRGRTVDRQSQKGRMSLASNRTASAPAFRDNDLDEEVPRKPLCCDRCDGPHETDDCPHFKKPREKHADAWSSYGKKNANGKDQEVVIIRNARVVPQPADGSCLFHSLSYGLADRSTAQSLRRDICSYLEKHPDTVIADTSLKDWIHYDSGGTVQSYANKMSGSTWGGGIEMAALTKMKNVNVHVYEKCDEGFRRISSFDNPNASKTISVLYKGRMHYEAIVV